MVGVGDVEGVRGNEGTSSWGSEGLCGREIRGSDEK